MVDATTGEAIRRAVVRADYRGAGGAVSTDAEGRFEIRDLPAGRYTVMASKAGYVAGIYGQTDYRTPGTPIEIGDGQIIERIRIPISPGGVITGHLSDDFGDPVAEATVTALEYRTIAGRRRLMPAGGSRSMTDDQGSFRIYGLSPGEYYLSATSRMGNLVYSSTMRNETEGAAPTYYPGTADIGQAQRVVVKASQETAGINFGLVIARMSTLRGRALDSSGRPAARAMAMLVPRDPGTAVLMMSSSNLVRPDGTFEVANVPPGAYTLMIRPMGQTATNPEFGSLAVTVGYEDLDGLVVTMGVGATARGRVVTDEGTPPPFPARQVRIYFANPEPGLTMVAPQRPDIRDDFTFEVGGLSGTLLVRASADGANEWGVKEVLLDGVDVTDSAVDFTGRREVTGFEIVLTRRRTEISGTLTDERGRPVLDAMILVFSPDPDKWGPLSRYRSMARPDQSGRFVVTGLPPASDYRMVAVQNMDPGEAMDPEFLETIRDQGIRITLSEGEQKVQNLTLRQP
ncbi:MAG: collagen binding domain-containing protein [Vicinamibacterales bacterium]